jgi:hypothetical protein
LSEIEYWTKGMTKESLREKSPFTTFFNSAIAETDVSGDESYAVNDIQRKEGFRILREIVHLYPIWAAALQHDLDRFTETSTSQMPPSMPKSNAIIESRFRYKLVNLNNMIFQQLVIGNLVKSFLVHCNGLQYDFPENDQFILQM